ncbi:MAG: flagellar filament capping protein FliD [Candidatus Omnitrophica bacterium]|nr:flagellar filament capping protein FliD [Candidatus Omnitrophota bacterium]
MSVGSITPAQIWEVVKSSFERENAKIEEKETEITAQEDKKLAYDHIDNVLEELRASLYDYTKTSLFLQRSVTSSNPDIVVASATSRAPATSFTFDSITQLATAARVSSSGGLGLSAGTKPYVESDSDVNGGTVDDYDPNLAITNAQGGGQVTAGTFTINDVEITVTSGDTLNTILTKINNSGAGVTAVFDDPQDLVRISGTIVGSDEEITFDDGDTNFFTAMNLTTPVAGTDDDWKKPLDDTGLGVSSGYFTINNRTFYVDTATESLDDVIRRINNSSASVTIYYDEVADTVTLQNREEGVDLLLANDTSGFLTALNLMNQGSDLDAHASYSRYEGDKAQFTLNGEALERDTNTFTIQGVTFSLLGTSASSTSVTITQDKEKSLTVTKDFISQFNASLAAIKSEIEKEGGPLENDFTLRNMYNQLLNDVLSKIDNPGQYNSLVDVGFSTERSRDGQFTLSLDEEKFRDALDEDELSLHQLFAYDSDGDGLLDEGGFAIDTRSYLNEYTRAVSGFFYKQNDRIYDRIDDLKIDLYDMEEDLTKAEEKKFYELAQQVVQLQEMQQQQAYINQISQVVTSMLMQGY